MNAGPNELIEEHLRKSTASIGVHLDKYDPAAILGSLCRWLEQHDAALTGSGVVRLADLEVPQADL
jgi:hypothetical protein